ncbi:MAG TPA: urease subunit beta [Oculatellaceae cyanobacterium]
MKPGEFVTPEGDITINQGKRTCSLTVTNRGDRPVQVGSHFHFFEANKALSFEREAALGMRLNIKAGTAVRFEPGQTTTVELVEIGGTRFISGFNRLVEGSLSDESVRRRALDKVKEFCDKH